MVYIRRQRLFVFIFFVFTIFAVDNVNQSIDSLEYHSIGHSDSKSIDLNLSENDSLTEVNELGPILHNNNLPVERKTKDPDYVFGFDKFKVNIHRIINLFLDLNHQGSYSIINTEMSQIREYYLSMRVKHLLYAYKSTKTQLLGNQLLSFDTRFRSLMNEPTLMNDIDYFYSSQNVPKEMKFNTFEPTLLVCEFCQQECDKYITGKISGKSLCNKCYQYEHQHGYLVPLNARKRKHNNDTLLVCEFCQQECDKYITGKFSGKSLCNKCYQYEHRHGHLEPWDARKQKYKNNILVCEICQEDSDTLITSTNSGKTLCPLCYQYEYRKDQLGLLDQCDIIGKDAYAYHTGHVLPLAQRIYPKEVKRKRQKHKNDLSGKELYIYDRSTGILNWKPYYRDEDLIVSPTFPLAIKYTVNGEQHLEFLRYYRIDEFKIVDRNIFELKLKPMNSKRDPFRWFCCRLNTNSDAVTNVESVQWSLLEYLYADYIISDNTLKLVRQNGNLVIDAITFVDLQFTFKVIYSVPVLENN